MKVVGWPTRVVGLRDTAMVPGHGHALPFCQRSLCSRSLPASRAPGIVRHDASAAGASFSRPRAARCAMLYAAACFSVRSAKSRARF